MPGGASGYLPPVVAQLLADIGPLVVKVEEAKAILTDFAAKDYTARIGVELDPATLAKVAALQGAIGAGAGGGGGGGLLAGAAAGAAAGGGGGKGGLMAGLMAVLMGKGGMFGLAGIGSALGLAGFGFEHVLMTALGLAGSAAGGALGGGAIALGGLGTMGVGMGSDIAVAKSTLADTKTLTTAYGNLANAVKLYGANSAQATAAQTALNNQITLLGGAGQVGVAAEMKLAQAAIAFNVVWDKVTQNARAAFVNNLAMPALQMAQGYLPLIAAAATRNFGIIGTAMRPLFAFLAGPGHQIFTDLENVFARDLPIGTGIFVQSLELILKTMDHIAMSNSFGSFLQKILTFVTNLNGAGFDHFMGQVDKMIGLFHIWATFIGVLGRDIFDMFSQTVGLGSGIIVTLTGMLQKLGDWERSVAGKNAMGSLFAVHKAEIIALLGLIPVLVHAIGPVYLQLSTIFTQLAVPIIALVVHVLDFLTHIGGGVGQVISFALGLALIEAKGHLLVNTFIMLRAAFLFFVGLPAMITRLIEFAAGLNLVAVGTRIATAAQWLLNIALDANPIGLVILAVAGLVTAFILLVTHFQLVQQWLDDVYKRFGPFIDIVLACAGPIGVVIQGLAQLIMHFQTIVVWASKLPGVGGAFKGLADMVTGSTGHIGQSMKTMATNVVASTAWMSGTVSADFQNMAANIYADALRSSTGITGSWVALDNSAAVLAHDIGVKFDQGFINGIYSDLGGIWSAAYTAGRTGVNALGQSIGYHSPSRLAFAMGAAVVQGFANGIKANTQLAVAAMLGLGQQTLGAGRVSMGRGGFGGLAMAGASGGSVVVHSSPVINITGATGNPQQIGDVVQKALDKHTANLVKMLKGGVYLPGQGLS